MKRRQKAFRWFTRKCGITEGMEYPLWARVLRLIVIPEDIVPYMAAGVYSFTRDEYTIAGIRLSGEIWDAWKYGHLPSPWFRIVARENDTFNIETMPQGWEVIERMIERMIERESKEKGGDVMRSCTCGMPRAGTDDSYCGYYCPLHGHVQP